MDDEEFMDALCRDAADAEVLRPKVAALVKALEEIAAQVNDRWDDHCGHLVNHDGEPDRPHEPTCPYDIARRALAVYAKDI